MNFIPISIDKYIKLHLKNNPSEDANHLKRSLKKALADYKNGVKCSCGNEIWVIGSASTGNSCFTCITGESYPDHDYEIDSVLKKTTPKKSGRHINDIDPTQIAGFFTDDGYEINTDMIKKPSLCIICSNEDEILCPMTRYDQRNETEFKCDAFIKN